MLTDPIHSLSFWEANWLIIPIFALVMAVKSRQSIDMAISALKCDFIYYSTNRNLLLFIML